MTTWTREAARDIYRQLEEVDRILAGARTAIGVRNYRRAWDAVGAAMQGKLAAIRVFPVAECPADPQGVPYAQLYGLFEGKDLVLFGLAQRAASDANSEPNGMWPDYEGSRRNLVSSRDQFKALRDDKWPAPHPCRPKFDAIITVLENALAALDATPRDLDTLGTAYMGALSAQIELIECVYPDSPVSSGVFIDLFQMDTRLMEAYDSLKYQRPIWPDVIFDPDHVRRLIGGCEQSKHQIMRELERAYPGIEVGQGPHQQGGPRPV